MTKAQQEFIARKESSDAPADDARDFLTWYHPDDIHRIAYSIYQMQTEKTQELMHAPVMVLGSESHSFTDKMAFCHYALEQSGKQILPFIIAPEIGAAHFMAGFIAVNPKKNQPQLFLFNPTGYTKDSARRRLAIEDIDSVAGMAMHVSSTKVQTIEKDQLEGKKGPALVSCGPISLMFIEYLLKNPQYALQLDEQFVLPEPLSKLEAMSTTAYQEQVRIQRQTHHTLLGTIADQDLERVDTVQYQLTAQFLDEDWKQTDASWDDYELETDSPVDDSSESSSPVKEQSTKGQKEESVSDSSSPIEKIESINEQKEENIAVSVPLVEKGKFDDLLKQLKKKTNELIKKGELNSPHHPQYKNAKTAAENLIRSLEKASTQFFPNEINATTFQNFKTECIEAIDEAKKEFKNHRGGWYALNPILRGFIGVLATLTLIPALVVQGTSKQGYIGTFFNSPKTNSMTQLESFESNLEIYCTQDVAPKIK